MYGCESYTIKQALHWRVDAFELWCWKRQLSVPWTARRSNQSILKETSPEYSSEGLMLKLKLQYFAPWCKNWLLGRDPDAGKDWRQEEKGMAEEEMVGWITDSMDISLSKLQELVMAGKPAMLQSIGLQRVRHDWATEHAVGHEDEVKQRLDTQECPWRI